MKLEVQPNNAMMKALGTSASSEAAPINWMINVVYVSNAYEQDQVLSNFK
jgi:hypothetical protein